MASNIKDSLLRGVAASLNRPMLDAQTATYVLEFYNKIDPELFRERPIEEVLPIVINVIAQRIKQQATNTVTQIQPQTLVPRVNKPAQSQEEKITNASIAKTIAWVNPTDIKISSFLGLTDTKDIRETFNPESLLKYYYVALDSDYRLMTDETSSTTSVKQFKWLYSPDTVTGKQGYCTSIGQIQNIKSMRIFQPRIPYVNAMNTSSKRVSLLINEFSTQAFSTTSGEMSFHFLFRPNYASAGTSIDLSIEDYNDGVYTFNKPIPSFDTLTISFGDPLNKLAFNPQTMDKFFIVIEFCCIVK